MLSQDSLPWALIFILITVCGVSSYKPTQLFLHRSACPYSNVTTLSASLEHIEGSKFPSTFKVQLFPQPSSCSRRTKGSRFSPQKQDYLPVLLVSTLNQCINQTILNDYRVKMLIISRNQWTYKNKTFEDLQSNFTIFIIQREDFRSVYARLNSCPIIIGELLMDKMFLPSINKDVSLPNLLFGLEYTKSFSYWRQVYFNHFSPPFLAKMAFKHMQSTINASIIFTGTQCVDCIPQRDCFPSKEPTQSICYQPNPGSFQTGRQNIKEQLRSLLLLRKYGYDFWFKYVILFSDSNCHAQLYHLGCIKSVLLELNVGLQDIAKIQRETQRMMNYQHLQQLQTQKVLVKFYKTSRSTYLIYESRIYTTLQKLCKQMPISQRPREQCDILAHQPITIRITKLQPVITDFVEPNLQEEGVVEQKVTVEVDAGLKMTEMLIILRAEDQSYKDYLDLQTSNSNNFTNASRIANFTLVKYSHKARKQIELTSRRLQRHDKMQGLFSDGPTSKLTLRFTGHRKYTLELHPKTKQSLIKPGSPLSFLARVDIINSQFIKSQYYGLNLLLEDITDPQLFNYLLQIKFYGQFRFTLLPVTKTNGIDWFKKFDNRTVNNKKITSGDRNILVYQVYSIDKALLMQVRQKSSFCASLGGKINCKVPFYLKMEKQQRSYVRDGHFKKVIGIKLTRYQDKTINRFNNFVRDVPVKTVVGQWIQMNNFGPANKNLPIGAQLAHSMKDVKTEIRVCRHYKCGLQSKNKWYNEIYNLTTILETKQYQSLYKDMTHNIFNFNSVKTQLPRYTKISTLKVYVIYTKITPTSKLDYFRVEQTLTNPVFYNQGNEYSQGGTFVKLNINYKQIHSRRFTFTMSSPSTYCVNLFVNLTQNDRRVFSKVSTFNSFDQIYFQPFNGQLTQQSYRVLQPNFYQAIFKKNSQFEQTLNVDIYVEAFGKKHVEEADDFTYNVAFSEYKGTYNYVQIMNLAPLTKVNIMTNEKQNNKQFLAGNPGFIYSKLLLILEPILFSDFKKVKVCFSRVSNNRHPHEILTKQRQQCHGSESIRFWKNGHDQQLGYGILTQKISVTPGLFFRVQHQATSEPIEIQLSYMLMRSQQIVKGVYINESYGGSIGQYVKKEFQLLSRKRYQYEAKRTSGRIQVKNQLTVIGPDEQADSDQGREQHKYPHQELPYTPQFQQPQKQPSGNIVPEQEDPKNNNEEEKLLNEIKQQQQASQKSDLFYHSNIPFLLFLILLILAVIGYKIYLRLNRPRADVQLSQIDFKSENRPKEEESVEQ